MYSKATLCLGLQVALLHVGAARSLNQVGGRSGASTCLSDDHCASGYFCHSDYRCYPCHNCVELNRGFREDCTQDIRLCGSCLDSLHITPVQASDARSLDHVGGSVGVGICLNNYQCPSGYFCHGDYKCYPCHNCSALNRTAGEDCAQDVRLCGSCLNGYKEKTRCLSNGTRITTGACVKDTNFKLAPQTSNSNYHPSLYVCVVIGMVYVALIPLIYAFLRQTIFRPNSSAAIAVIQEKNVTSNSEESELVPLRLGTTTSENGIADIAKGTADYANWTADNADVTAVNTSGTADNVGSENNRIERRHSYT